VWYGGTGRGRSTITAAAAGSNLSSGRRLAPACRGEDPHLAPHLASHPLRLLGLFVKKQKIRRASCYQLRVSRVSLGGLWRRIDPGCDFIAVQASGRKPTSWAVSRIVAASASASDESCCEVEQPGLGHAFGRESCVVAVRRPHQSEMKWRTKQSVFGEC
jgi:hypothetical protein